MRVLIGNDTDQHIVAKVDTRSWSQRVLWFARNHDLIILSSEPDQDFVRFVTRLTGVDSRTLRFVILPSGQSEGRLFEYECLLSEKVTSQIKALAATCESIIPMWPSPHISSFSERTGIPFLGAPFFSQYGVEACNNKSFFRMLAAGQGVSISKGRVCPTQAEATLALREILDSRKCAFVKKTHSTSGAGNLLVTTDSSIVIQENVGCRYYEVIGSDLASVQTFWEEYWQWASHGDRFPVIVEEYLDVVRTIYAEFYCDDVGVQSGEIGELFYESGTLTIESSPASSLPDSARKSLLEDGKKLANIYQTMGCRGPLSADAVLLRDGRVVFTEVNVRFTGSTHLYGPIRGFSKDRVISQRTPGELWNLKDTADFLSRIEASGLLYDSSSRKGVFPITPPVNGYPVYGISAESEAEQRLLNERFLRSFPRPEATSCTKS